MGGRGIERWVSMRIADSRGVWAAARYPFPRPFIDEILALAAGPLDEDPYSPIPLTFRLYSRLKESRNDEVQRYVDGDPARCFSLARTLADLFNLYLVYRPDWVKNDGPDAPWQRELWRETLEELGPIHFAERARQTVAALRADEVDRLPERVSVFGVTHLPPAYLAVLIALSDRIPLHLFIFSPTREYWGEGQSQLVLFGAKPDESEPPLLTALGRHSRSFCRQLDRFRYVDGAIAYVDPPARSLLATLQSDLVNFRTRGAHTRGATYSLTEDDQSVQVHRCHSRMREVEVVHDVLLKIFKTQRDLAPHRVVVMAPNIDEYAPLVDAVFGTRGQIPYRITGRSFAGSDSEWRAVNAWLDLVGGRVSSLDILDLLNSDPVRLHFEFDADDLKTLRQWVVDSGVRWGIDAEHRAMFGQPADSIGTWNFGIARMWAGVAVDGFRHPLADDVAPLPRMRGSHIDLVARFERMIQRVKSDVLFSRETHPASDWCEWLRGLIGRFSISTSKFRGVATARLTEVSRWATHESLSWTSMREFLVDPLRSNKSDFGFLSGEMTVCELTSMRSIPFDFVVLVGMNDSEFPRSPVRNSLDATLALPRPGDVDPLADDLNLFLEALVSARHGLVVSYVGRSAKDNSLLPPSTVVDALRTACESCAGGNAWSKIERDHPLHAHSMRYGGADPRFFTFEARSPALPPPVSLPPGPWINLAGPPRSMTSIDLDDVARMLHDAPRYWFERVLGARLPRPGSLVLQREAIELDGLGRWQLVDQILESLSLFDVSELTRLLRCSGALPPGALGRLEAMRALRPAESLLAASKRYACEYDSEWRDVSIQFGDAHLTGRLDSLFGRRRVEMSPSRADHRVGLRAWLMHLVGLVSDVLDESVVIRLDGRRRAVVSRYGPVSEPRRRLDELVRIFELGHRVPLPLFRHASPYYARLVSGGLSPWDARPKARSIFEQNDWDGCVRLMFGPESVESDQAVGGLPEAEFSALAERVLLPAVKAERS